MLIQRIKNLNCENLDRKYIFATMNNPPPKDNVELQKIIAKHTHDYYKIRLKNIVNP